MSWHNDPREDDSGQIIEPRGEASVATDHLDKIIEQVLQHKPGKRVSISTPTLRAVAEAAIEHGRAEGYPGGGWVHVERLDNARRELANEAMEIVAKELEEFGSVVQRAGVHAIKTLIREIAGEGE